MRKVLIIAPYFVPRRRVGALRPFKFAIHLREFGWEPVVITIAEKNQKLTEKEKVLLNGVKVIEIDTPFDQTTQSKTKAEKQNKFRIVNQVSSWIDRNTPVDSWIFLFWFNYLRILSKVKELNPDVIWSTGDPWSGLWLGEKLADDLSKPWVADFRDPWTITDVNLRDRSVFSEEADRNIEQRIIEKADKVTFTSGAARMAYQNHYHLTQSKTAVVYNSYDLSLLNESNEHSWSYNPDPKLFHILFFGRFRRLSPAEPLIEAIRYLRKIEPVIAEQIRIHSFGKLIPEEAEKIDSLDMGPLFIQHEPVKPQKSLSVLKKTDLLLVSTDRDRKYIIPAKLWDYLATDKPILSIAPNPEIAEILEYSKAGIGFHPDELRDIAMFLKRCVMAKQEGIKIQLYPGKDSPDRLNFESRATTEKLSMIFDEILKDE
jgi:glycosyltransferase involved in cell wall biosynthesis